jgi:hypothetical protein
MTRPIAVTAAPAASSERPSRMSVFSARLELVDALVL